MVKTIKAVRLFGHIILGLVLLVLTGGLWDNSNRALKATKRWWLFRITRLLGMEIEVIGSLPPKSATGTLFVSNHVSWTDIPVIGGLTQLNFLSKAEVKKWPLVGRLAHGSGTLFIQRGSGDASKVARDISDYLQQGRSVLFFPEGTTSNGRTVSRFHRKLFKTCEYAETLVCPLVIHYRVAGADNNPVAFIGDDELTRHIWNLLSYPRIKVTVTLLAPRVLTTQNMDVQVTSIRNEMIHHLEWLHAQSGINTSARWPDASSHADQPDGATSF